MGANVLIVEDHDNLRFLLGELLRMSLADLHLMEARSGEEALNLVSIRLPDIILMDVGLGETNGIEVSRRIKAICPQVQIVMLTSHEESQYQSAAGAAGACAYVTKRKMHSELIPVLRRLLSQGED